MALSKLCFIDSLPCDRVNGTPALKPAAPSWPGTGAHHFDFLPSTFLQELASLTPQRRRVCLTVAIHLRGYNLKKKYHIIYRVFSLLLVFAGSVGCDLSTNAHAALGEMVNNQNNTKINKTSKTYIGIC